MFWVLAEIIIPLILAVLLGLLLGWMLWRWRHHKETVLRVGDRLLFTSVEAF